MDSLSENERRLIEQKRQKALALRAEKLASSQTLAMNHTIQVNSSVSSNFKAQQSLPFSKPNPAPYSKPQSIVENNKIAKQKGSGFIANSQSIQFQAFFNLISKQRFQVDMKYHLPSINIFRTIPSRNYDAQEKKWDFALEDHDKLVEALRPLFPDVTVNPLPKFVISALHQDKNHEHPDLSKIDPLILNCLMPFQREGVEFGLLHNGRILLADDMGLGKTIEALAISDYYREEWPLLIITPASMRYLWSESIIQWLSHVSEKDICIVDSRKDDINPKALIVIGSYDLLAKRKDELKARNFKIIIFDESHFLKNPKSNRTQAAQVISKKASRIIMLSGTPALSRPVELYPQIAMIYPKLFPGFQAFGLRYCNGHLKPWGWDFSGSSNMKELQIILEASIMIRRLKSEVITQLPSKCRQMILLDSSSVNTDRKYLQKMSKEIQKTSLKGMERRGVLLEYFRETANAKLPAICAYIKDLIESQKKFIIFAHHQVIIKGICETLDDIKCNYIKIDGATPSEMRKANCDIFMFHDSCRVAILSITAANSGITLTSANLVVFAELFWNPGILTQAEDRAHRIGQQDSVTIQYLVAKGTADDHIWPLVQRKLNFLNKAGLSKDNFSEVETKVHTNTSQSTLDSFFEELCKEDPDYFYEDIF